MNRADWLEWRRDGLGGSDVAAILGLFPWSSAFDVWWSKVRSLEDKGSAVKSRGQLLEDAVLQWAKSELGSGLVRGSPLVHPSLSWARGTPDAWTDVDEGLEAKTVRVFEDELWGESGSDVVPLHYRIQCAWYMAITGAKIWRLAAFSTLQEDWRIFELEPEMSAGSAAGVDSAGTDCAAETSVAGCAGAASAATRRSCSAGSTGCGRS